MALLPLVPVLLLPPTLHERAPESEVVHGVGGGGGGGGGGGEGVKKKCFITSKGDRKPKPHVTMERGEGKIGRRRRCCHLCASIFNGKNVHLNEKEEEEGMRMRGSERERERERE